MFVSVNVCLSVGVCVFIRCVYDVRVCVCVCVCVCVRCVCVGGGGERERCVFVSNKFD